VCTVPCVDDTACTVRLAADSLSSSGLNLECRAPECSTDIDKETAPAAVCDVKCDTDANCLPLGTSYVCEMTAQGGHCRTQAPLSSSVQKNPCPGNMRLIPGGTLVDGGGVSHTIASFCLDRTEVSVASYQACMDAMVTDCVKPARGNLFIVGGEVQPINDVTLANATAFCGSIAARLPTALEWQWAAQGGSLAQTYPWGNDAPTADNSATLVCALGVTGTCAEGGREAGADPWLVTDLVGNVAELVTTDAGTCVAGGSYASTDPVDITSSVCLPFTTEDVTIGFRCAKAIP